MTGGKKRLGSSSSSKKPKAEKKAKKRAAAIAAVDAARHDPVESSRLVVTVGGPSGSGRSVDSNPPPESPSPAPSDRLVIEESQPPSKF